MDADRRLRDLYVAFNARDADAVLAALAPDVDWPNAWEGGRVHGREAVREYWTRQWAEISSTVEPTAVDTHPDGEVAVTVRQVARALDGTLLGEGTVVHAYRFDAAGLVTRMDVREQ